MRKNLVFFQGNTQYKNTGDVLINKSLLDHLRKYSEVLVNDKNMPAEYIDRLEVAQNEKVSNRTSKFSMLLNICAVKGFLNRELRVYLIAGPPGHLFGNSRKKNIRNVISGVYFFLLRIFGVKIVKIGFSLGPLGKELCLTERFRAIPTNYYLVRDSLSLDLAHKIGINKAYFFPDLAWTYKALTYPKKERTSIVVSFRDAVVTGVNNGGYLEALQLSLIRLLSSVKGEYQIKVTFQVEMDYEFCLDLYRSLKGLFHEITFVEEQITLESAAIEYTDAVCIITNRLHGALLGYKYGALPVVLTDSKDHLKITGIYRDAKIEDLILNIHNTIESNVIKFKKLLENRDEILANIGEVESEYQVMSETILSNIFK